MSVIYGYCIFGKMNFPLAVFCFAGCRFLFKVLHIRMELFHFQLMHRDIFVLHSYSYWNPRCLFCSAAMSTSFTNR